jgi:hypothetical protein
MAATISTYDGTPPTLTGLLTRGVTITGGTNISEDSDIREMLRLIPHNIPRIEPGHTMYLAGGWNTLFFSTDAPITISHYKVWFSEDFQSGNRSTKTFRFYAGLDPRRGEQPLLDEVCSTAPVLRKVWFRFNSRREYVSPPRFRTVFSAMVSGAKLGRED